MVGRLRQHRVQRHDERLQQLLEERQDVVAVAASEDPVFVLEEDDVDVESAEDPGRPHVVVPHCLVDRRRHTRPLGTGGLVDDHDLLDPFDLVQSQQGRADVGRERADSAGARWIGGNDRGAQGLPAYPSVEIPMPHRSVRRSRLTATLADIVFPGPSRGSRAHCSGAPGRRLRQARWHGRSSRAQGASGP